MNISRMPRITNSHEYLAGYISGRMSELHAMLDTLQSETHSTELEMQHMRNQIMAIDASIRTQHRGIADRRVRPSLDIYNGIQQFALRELERRESHRGARPPESEAMRARRLRTDRDLDAYASDGRGPVPLENWTVVNPAPSRPIVSANDLRRALEDKRMGRFQWQPAGFDVSNEVQHRSQPQSPEPCESSAQMETDDRAGPSGVEEIENRQRRPQHERRVSTSSSEESRNERRSVNSARSRSSIQTYASSQQSRFRTAQWGIPLPPWGNQLPRRINRNDPGLIGSTEIYVQRPSVEGRERCPPRVI